MSKKHYIAIAAILKNAETVGEATVKLADYLAKDNSRFDRSRFLAAAARGVNR